jgi:hypothetical protein
MKPGNVGIVIAALAILAAVVFWNIKQVEQKGGGMQVTAPPRAVNVQQPHGEGPFTGTPAWAGLYGRLGDGDASVHDPFIGEKKVGGAEMAEKLMKVRTIIFTPDSKVASIDGQLVKTGDNVGEFQVSRIESDKVVLTRKNTKEEVVLLWDNLSIPFETVQN